MKRFLKYTALSLLITVLSLPLWAQMVVPTIPAGGGSGATNPASIAGLYCLLTGCTIDPGPFIVNGEFEVNNAVISACGAGGPCSAGPAYQDRVGIGTATPITDLDVNGSVNIGSVFTQFDSLNNTVGINTNPGTNSSLPLQVGAGIQIQSAGATACTAVQKGAMQNDVNGNLQVCDQEYWWTIASRGPNNSFPVSVTTQLEMTGGALECNGAFGDCVDGDEVNSMRAQGTTVGTCTKFAAGTGAIFRSPCATSSNSPRKMLGGRDCVEFQQDRVPDNFFACPTPWGPAASYSACFVGQPLKQGDMKEAAAWNLCGNGGTANRECGYFFLKTGFDMSLQTGTVALNSNQVQNLNHAPIAGELIVSCYSVDDVSGANPSGLIARSGGLRGAAGFDANSAGTAQQPRTWNIGGSGTGAVGTQPLFQGYILGLYAWQNTAFTADQLETVVDTLLLKYRSYN